MSIHVCRVMGLLGDLMTFSPYDFLFHSQVMTTVYTGYSMTLTVTLVE